MNSLHTARSGQSAPSLQIVSRVADVAQTRGYETRSDLARATGLSVSTVSRWWGQLPHMLYLSTLAAFCEALDAQPGDLLAVQNLHELPPA